MVFHYTWPKKKNVASIPVLEFFFFENNQHKCFVLVRSTILHFFCFKNNRSRSESVMNSSARVTNGWCLTGSTAFTEDWSLWLSQPGLSVRRWTLAQTPACVCESFSSGESSLWGQTGALGSVSSLLLIHQRRRVSAPPCQTSPNPNALYVEYSGNINCQIL